MLDELMPMAFLGIVAMDETDAVRVTQIYRESGAEAAGLEVGDVLLAFGGERVTGKNQLYQDIRRYLPGTTVDVLVLRDGRERPLRATLGRRWEEDEEDVEQYLDLGPEPYAPHGLPAVLDLERAPLGETPAGVEQVLGGLGGPPRFVTVMDGDAIALRQSAPEKTGIHFPMALIEGVDADDVVGRVRFRFVSGAQDRTAGIVLHYHDENNYLVARANAVEGDMRIFRTVNGLRRTLPGAVAQVDLDDEAWHTLEFRIEGPQVTAVLDGSTSISSYDTYFLHGRVGVWTKSDAVTDFAGISFTAP